MLFTTIIILVVIASILMCGIVFIQESKGGGLASGFSSGNSMLGVRKTTDVVEKTTWSLAAIMVVLSIVSVFALNGREDATVKNQSVTESIPGALIEQTTSGANQTVVPSTPAADAVEAPADAAVAPVEAPAEAE